MAWFSAALILLGWVALMAAMERHADVFGALPASTRRTLRAAAGIAFATSFALFVATRGVGQGPVYWTACLMLGAIATVLAGAWASRRTVRQR